MNGEKRKNRGYKISDRAYRSAMKQAKKDKWPISQIIEALLSIYGSTGHWPSWDEVEYKIDRKKLDD